MQTELVGRARRGDREAFGVLAVGAVDWLYAIARLILRDAELAEDATQDALVRAWRDDGDRSRPQGGPDGPSNAVRPSVITLNARTQSLLPSRRRFPRSCMMTTSRTASWVGSSTRI